MASLVINAVDPWLSTADLNAGTRWNVEVSKNLQESGVGIFCLTPENLDSTWLAFEAGAIAKSVDNSLACTYLYDLEPSQVRWPLAQFQAKLANKSSTFEMVKSINHAANPPLLRADLLTKAFEKWWPDLEAQLNAVPKASAAAAKNQKRDASDLLEEVLLMLRQQGREIPAAVARAADLAKNHTLGMRRPNFERRLREHLRSYDSRLERFRMVDMSRTPREGRIRIRDGMTGGVIEISVIPELLDDASELARHLQGHLVAQLPKDGQPEDVA